MNENREYQRLHDALENTLSPVTGDPQLEARLLTRLQADDSPSRPALRPARLLLIPALLLLLLTGAFAAERLGLFDMLLTRHEGGVLPEATQLVDVPVTLHATQSDYATVTVVQSLRSGGDVVLLIEATPRTEGILLAPADLLGPLAENGAYRTLMGFGWEDEDAPLTHAEGLGRRLIALDLHLQLPEDEKGSPTVLTFTILDGELLADGGMRLLLHIRDGNFTDDDELTLQMRWGATPVVRSAAGACVSDVQQRSAAFMTFSLPASPRSTSLAMAMPALTAVGAALPITVDEAGIRIDSVDLVRTPLYTRFEVSYTCLFSKAGMSEHEVFFLLSDEEGRWLTDGLRGGGVPRGSWPSITRVGYGSALPGTVEEIWLTVMPFGSNEPLALVRVPVGPVPATSRQPAAPTPAP